MTAETKAPKKTAESAGSDSKRLVSLVLSQRRRRGCPTCEGVDPKSCMRCNGQSRMCDWFYTDTGWAHYFQMTRDEQRQADRICSGQRQG